MAKTVEVAAGRPAVLTVHEVARALHISRKTVFGMLARGALPGAMRVGGNGMWRIPRSAHPFLKDA